MFVKHDCSLAEINPLVVTGAGDLLALDAKMTFDDNALFRHKDLAELRDISEEEPAEVRAGKAGLSYVKLDGNIGCLVNGAGLAMSTMDLIKLHGGEPANFLDVGGGANVEQVTEAFRILLSDKNVKAVLVNIFGGIMRCTTIATAIVQAYQSVGFNVPLVVRLEGTEVEEARKMLADSKLNIIGATGLTDAAKKVVARLVPESQLASQYARSHEHPDQQADPRPVPRHHRQGGPVPHQGLPRVRHADRRRRHAGQGRRERSTACPSSTPCSKAVKQTGADAADDLRAAGVHRRRDPGSGRCRHQAWSWPSPRACRSSTWSACTTSSAAATRRWSARTAPA